MIFIDMEEEVRGLAKTILDQPDILYADIESTGLDWIVNDILLFQIKYKGEIYVIDVRKIGYGVLREFISWTGTQKYVFHNTKFDIKFIYHRTGILLPNVYDTMTAEAVLNSGKTGGKPFYSLEELALKYAGVEMDKSTRKQFVDYPADKPFTEAQINYSALDVQVLEDIYIGQMKQFEETKQLRVIQLESDLIPVVAKMEYDGVRIDTKMWLEIEKEVIKQIEEKMESFNKEIVDFLVNYGFENALDLTVKAHLVQKNKLTKKLTQTLTDMTDLDNMRGWIEKQFNVRSSQQMTTIFNLMGIKCKNTNEKTLEDFKKYPIVEKLIEIRGLNKQVDQYGSNFLKAIHPVTGKVHTEYMTVGTQTGRFSSNNPNLQNIPVHGGYRECFLPDEGYLFAGVDYSQQEYRLAGAVSKEPVIIHAYQNGSDMHTATGKIVAKKDTITKDERSRGKTVNFAILYGSTEWGLKRNLRIKIEEAQEIIKAFWDGYPNLKDFMQLVGERILKLGYSCTPIGRRRYNIDRPLYANSDEFVKWRERVLREGRNHIIQGGGADIIKLAMVRISKENPFGELLRLTLQIHDEIVFQIHKSIAQEGLEFVMKIMEEEEQKFLGDIPAKVDGELKERWSK